MGRTIARAWRLALLSLLMTSAASAQDAQRIEEARQSFERGHAAYEAGRFEEALEHFQHSFELTEEPTLLYNIASVYDRLRRDREALDAYRRFLELRPDTPDREQVLARIEVLERTLATAAEPPAEPALDVVEPSAPGAADLLDGAQPTTAPRQTEPWEDWPMWVIVAGAVVAAVAIALGVHFGTQGPSCATGCIDFR